MNKTRLLEMTDIDTALYLETLDGKQLAQVERLLKESISVKSLTKSLFNPARLEALVKDMSLIQDGVIVGADGKEIDRSKLSPAIIIASAVNFYWNDIPAEGKELLKKYGVAQSASAGGLVADWKVKVPEFLSKAKAIAKVLEQILTSKATPATIDRAISSAPGASRQAIQQIATK